ncbi:MAG: DUF975 family protein [Clostridia bacterium]|nr:DUF975 family protein [Clostridia bacterium]
MLFDRKKIKEAAKMALKRSHWMVVGAVLIVTLLGGTLAGEMVGGGTNINIDLPFGNEDTTVDPDVDIWAPGADEGVWEGDPWTEDPWAEDPWAEDENYTLAEIWEDFIAEITAIMEDFSNEIGVDLQTGLSIFAGVLIGIVVVAILGALALKIFVGNVMTVGGHGWLMRYWRNETPAIGEVFAAFRIYKPSVVTMLVKNIYVFLWSLLFVIPGIIKGFAYSMVPYIIYENPNLTANQAIKMSEKMTDGYKADLFVFNLSFIGWNLLSAITGGLVGVLYVNPYIGVAHAGVYEELKWNAIWTGRLSWEDFGQLPPPSDPCASPAAPGGYTYAAPTAPYGAPAPAYTPTANSYGVPTPTYNSVPTYTPPNTPYVPPVQPPAPPIPNWDDSIPPQE